MSIDMCSIRICLKIPRDTPVYRYGGYNFLVLGGTLESNIFVSERMGTSVLSGWMALLIAQNAEFSFFLEAPARHWLRERKNIFASFHLAKVLRSCFFVASCFWWTQVNIHIFGIKRWLNGFPSRVRIWERWQWELVSTAKGHKCTSPISWNHFLAMIDDGPTFLLLPEPFSEVFLRGKVVRERERDLFFPAAS